MSMALTLLTLLPLLGALAVASLPAGRKELARRLGLGFSLAAMGLAMLLWNQFDAAASFNFVEQYSWIPSWNLKYHVGVDGLGMLMVVLTALVIPFSLVSSWHIEDQPKVYFALVLGLEAGLFGVFTALNFFHWFIFWELSLIPAYFLIKLWGGTLRTPAAMQFFIYTMVGSVAMLLAFQALYLATGTFDFATLARLAKSGQLSQSMAALAQNHGWKNGLGQWMPTLIFGGVFLGLAVKVPLIPFHTWLPAAYAEAPAGTSMILTGVLSKMGVYGFLRLLLPVFPHEMQALLPWLLGLAVLTIVASAGAAMAQKDLKRVVAYSSINHLGYCLLGIFAAAQATDARPLWADEKAAALNGVILQMFNHGISASALFCFVGLIERRAGGRRGLEDFGGLRQIAPVFAGLMGITVFSSLGLPGLNGFIGEFLIFKGAFSLVSWAAVLSVAGLLLTAIFLLTLLQKVFNGPLNERWSGFPDLSLGERVMLAPVIAIIFIVGIYPQCILGAINSSVMQMVSNLAR